ncbi:unnamed protein product [Rotaria sordida]|nr:unnamed protein product [Rotaria sordida]
MNQALIIRSNDRQIDLKIRGIRPDNILFLIHEVLESLVNESFSGVKYDIVFPCPDCLYSNLKDPGQFSSSLINRAIKLKAKSIQCHQYFHIAPVPDLQAFIPPDSNSNYDLHLEYCVRDLKFYKENVTVDIVYLYPPEHIPIESEIKHKVDPRKIKKDLTESGFTVWTPESMKDLAIEKHYLIIKQADCILFGVSTELVCNAVNKNLYDAFQYITKILRKSIIPIVFGENMEWRTSELGLELPQALYVDMRELNKYDNNIEVLVSRIQRDKNQHHKYQQISDEPSDVFISYCWANSHDAVKHGTKTTDTSLGWGDPRVLKSEIEKRGFKVWMDTSCLGETGVFRGIAHGLKNTKVVVACVSDEYVESEICRNEFFFAKNTLRLPVILAIMGTGKKWRQTEDICNKIQSILNKRLLSPTQAPSNTIKKSETEETIAAHKELVELTQRKFLRIISDFLENKTTQPYPRLFTLDFMNEEEKSAQVLARIEKAAQTNTYKTLENDRDNREQCVKVEVLHDKKISIEQQRSDVSSKADTQDKEITAKSTAMEMKDSYAYLRRYIMDWDIEETYFGLKQCLMPSGKVLWLCKEHQKLPRVLLLTDSMAGSYNDPKAEQQSEIIKALAELDKRIANNELAVPSTKVSATGNVGQSTTSDRIVEEDNNGHIEIASSKHENETALKSRL